MENQEQKTTIVVKYDFYQTETNVVITILVKNVNSEHSSIKFSSRTISVNLTLPDGSKHEKLLNLAHEINPSQCSYRISMAKVEVKLKKVEGIRWEKLEGDPDVETPKQIRQEAKIASGPPSYPTSKPGKDWTAIERQIKQQESQEAPAGDEALNKLFQDIYGKGDDNVKRAMNKSYMESGGTVLSTNWGEISKDRVEIKPPDGMEWKKWDS